jgi:hypothetical protein
LDGVVVEELPMSLSPNELKALLASSTALEALFLALLMALDASLTVYAWFVTLDALLTLLGITLLKLSFALALVIESSATI